MSLIIFALSLTMLLGFAGYATDTGMIWVTRSRLQHSVDAAALSSAQELPDASEATAVACEFATQHNAVPGMVGKSGTCTSLADVTFPDANTIEVTAYRTVEPLFGQILGMTPVEVSASATVRIGSVGRACLFPYFVTPELLSNNDDFAFPISFLDKDRYINVGNWQDAADRMKSCTGDTPPDDEDAIGTVGESGIEIHPGTVNSTDKAWEEWVEETWAEWEDVAVDGSGGMSCPSSDVSTVLNAAGDQLKPGITFENCPRLIIVPVLIPSDAQSDKTGELYGFVTVYFGEIVSKTEITGYILRLDLASLDFPYSEYQPDLGTKIISLEN